MPRLTNKRYQQQLMLTMMLYVLVLFGAGPLQRTADSLPLKVLLAVTPVLPMLYVIALLWRRIRDSDELEQRTQLVALGAATALLSAVSMVGGFLAAGGVLKLDGTVLIWVFPVLMVGYSVAYKWVARHYGMDAMCVEDSNAWLPWYFVAMGVFMAAGALYSWWRHDTRGVLAFLLSACIFAVIGGWTGWRLRRARRQAEHGGA